MKISEAFPSNFLKADDLRGKPVIVTIESAEVEEIGQGRDKERKLVIGFKGKEKKLICNKTNAGTIGKLYGDETEAWLGQRVTLVPREVEYGGEMVWAIRVSLQKPGGAAVAPVPTARPQAPRQPEPAPDAYDAQPDSPPNDDGSGVPF